LKLKEDFLNLKCLIVNEIWTLNVIQITTDLNILNLGRYLFLNAIANQLRYPNSHTHYFSCTLLYLFAEANSEVIQEQITRLVLCNCIIFSVARNLNILK